MKSEYIKPATHYLPCTAADLLGESKTPFDPTTGTTEALGNEANNWDSVTADSNTSVWESSAATGANERETEQ